MSCTHMHITCLGGGQSRCDGASTGIDDCQDVDYCIALRINGLSRITGASVSQIHRVPESLQLLSSDRRQSVTTSADRHWTPRGATYDSCLEGMKKVRFELTWSRLKEHSSTSMGRPGQLGCSCQSTGDCKQGKQKYKQSEWMQADRRECNIASYRGKVGDMTSCDGTLAIVCTST